MPGAVNPAVETLGPEGLGAYEVDWSTTPPTFTRVNRKAKSILIPGFIDLHLHGAFGIDFMEATTDELRVLAERLESDGYEGACLTTVTAPASAALACLAKLPEDPFFLGVHLEGPFISPEYPGAQPPAAIEGVPVGASNWDAVFDHPRLRLVTLAPEIPRAVELINRLSNAGKIVSMGHTNASFDEARFGFEFGARHVTHTFNAMRPFHHREAGVVGYALLNESLTCELIYDRKHVSHEAAELLLACKQAGRVAAVSDSSKATGMPNGTRLTMWGHDCVVERGTVSIASSGALAGSTITLLDAFRNLTEDFGLETAIRLCCENPRRALGIVGVPRVYVELNPDTLEPVDRRVMS